MEKYITVRQIRQADCDNLASFFANNKIPEILSHFHPFPFTTETAQFIACQTHKDKYFTATIDDRIVGLSMLRGWDEGYDIPSFGIIIDYRYHRQGIGRLLLEFTLCEAIKMKCERVRLSVYASNVVALKLYYSLGFYEVSRQAVIGEQMNNEKIIMFKDLN